MTKNIGFNIGGEYIPKSYDTNADGKLSVFELNSWLKDNNCIFTNGKIVHKNTTPLSAIKSHPLSFHKKEFDGVVGYSYQSEITGDCWLLTGVNALSTTSWGRKAIKKAIKPDGYGGVSVTFKGSIIKQKEFHISAEEIQNASLSGFYTTGDPDMLAIELAAEKLYDKAIAQGKVYHDDYYDNILGHKTSINGCPMKLPSYEEYGIEKLLTGATPIHGYDAVQDKHYDTRLFKEIADNKDDYAVQVCFEKWKDLFGQREENEPIHGNHAYLIKSINYGVDVTLVDPYKTNENIVIPFDYFLEEISLLTITPNPNKKTKIHKYRIDSFEKCHEGMTKREQELDLIETIKKYDRESDSIKAIYDSINMVRRQKYYNDSVQSAHQLFINTSLDEWRFNDYKKESYEKFNKNNILEVFGNRTEKYGIESLKRQIKELIKYEPTPPFAFKYQRAKLDIMIKDMENSLIDAAKERSIDENIIAEFQTNCDKYISKRICFKRGEKLSQIITDFYSVIKKNEIKS